MAFMMIDDGWFCNDIDFWIGGMSIWQTFELSKRLSFHSQLYFAMAASIQKAHRVADNFIN